MCMDFCSLEAADLSWRAELLPTVKVSIVPTLEQGRVFGGLFCVLGDIAVLFTALKHAVVFQKMEYKKWTSDNWWAKSYV